MLAYLNLDKICWIRKWLLTLCRVWPSTQTMTFFPLGTFIFQKYVAPSYVFNLSEKDAFTWLHIACTLKGNASVVDTTQSAFLCPPTRAETKRWFLKSSAWEKTQMALIKYNIKTIQAFMEQQLQKCFPQYFFFQIADPHKCKYFFPYSFFLVFFQKSQWYITLLWSVFWCFRYQLQVVVELKRRPPLLLARLYCYWLNLKLH